MSLWTVFKAMFVSQGYDAVTAMKKAMAMAYQSMQAQANALSFKNSFWTMSAIVLCLTPLRFIMRRPRPGEDWRLATH